MLRSLTILAFFLSPILLFSQVMPEQQQEERLVRLIDAKSAELKTIDGREYRKVTGPAQFLHNNALIICDTAIWDVVSNTVDAIGNVKIIHNQTTLYSDQIKYIADRSVAEVRGRLVELVDKESNRLRTKFLDYFTKDSLAMFYNGGSMMNKDSNTIESLNGYYYGKLDKFLFQLNVQMEADSVVLTADSLAYMANEDKAIFLSRTYAWQDDGFLSANGGWYDRKSELFHFTKDAYIKTRENEIWADTINYNRNLGEAELFNNIQILDTAQSALVFADYATFSKKPFNVLLTKSPSVASYTIEEGVADTLFFSADTIKYYAFPKNEVDSAIVSQSETRLTQSRKDPIGELYKKAPLPKKPGKPGSVIAGVGTPETKTDTTVIKQPEQKEKTSLSRKERNKRAHLKDSTNIIKAPPQVIQKDTLVPVKDTLHVSAKDSVPMLSDSLGILKDTLPPAVDTTSIKFLYANKNIKFYRNNMQGTCDSLMFNSIDSLIRLFKDPVIWTEKNQLTSDSVQIVIEGRKLSKAELNSSAFVVTQEDSTHFDQIKGADVVAFFRKGELSRFDALGGVSILFFFAEDSVLTTMNEKECRAMSATFTEEKNLERIRYFESVQSNAYPLFDLEMEKQKLKGFRWLDHKRPKSRFDVSDRSVKPSKATFPETIEKPTFAQTIIYFGKKNVVGVPESSK